MCPSDGLCAGHGLRGRHDWLTARRITTRTSTAAMSFTRIFCKAIVAVLIAAPVFAQDASGFFLDILMSGFVDAYYAYNRNHPATPCAVVNGIQIFNCLHAFDVAQSMFSLNLANLAVEKVPTPGSRAGLRVALDF